MNRRTLWWLSVALAGGALPAMAGDVELSSPGLAPSKMDRHGRLAEDWGTFGVRVRGEGVTEAAPEVKACRVRETVPGAEARWNLGSCAMTATAFRAPVWPGGLDVYTVRVEETAGREASLVLALEVPEGVRPGSKTLAAGGRTVVALPESPNVEPVTREWGWNDDAVALPTWARPARECDPAFRHIRAGMGGVPIHYQFKVEPRASANVILGFCESHWTTSGQRPVVCQVEGTAQQEVDPIARWGQHQPGVVLFTGQDANGDGQLEVAVLPRIGAPDLNPILNVIWLFPPGPGLNLDQVLAGKLNPVATRYVDVGGPGDQSLLALSKVEYALKLPPKGTKTMTFLVACPGGSAPMPDRTAWTVEKLERAAVEVWRDWTKAPTRNAVAGR